MQDYETAVADHYGDAGLLTQIFAGLQAAGANLSHLRSEELAPVDEFHLGGREATAHLLSRMSLTRSQHVLDIGCGLGGAARHMASEVGCRVTGIDLTPDYVEVSQRLTDLTGLDDRVKTEVANALAMPFENARFNAAVSFHAAMNIVDRETLYRETARVLKPGALLGIYDVMKKGAGDLDFPTPWAQSPETSHLTSPEEMAVLLGGAGFTVEEFEDRSDTVLDFFRRASAAQSDGPPPLGLHIVLGPDASKKIGNIVSALKRGVIAPVMMIARRA